MSSFSKRFVYMENSLGIKRTELSLPDKLNILQKYDIEESNKWKALGKPINISESLLFILLKKSRYDRQKCTCVFNLENEGSKPRNAIVFEGCCLSGIL